MSNAVTQSVERAFLVVEHLAEHGEMGVSELSSQLDMPVSTVYDYLQSLTEMGYVTKADKQYKPTTKFLEVGYQQLHRSNIYRAARSELADLAARTGEHVTLMTEENGEGVLLDVQEGDQAVDFLAYPGARMPLHATAPGKAILAHLPEARVDDIIDRRGLPAITNNTVTEPERLREQLQAVRERGYAVDDGERIAGMVLVAAPVLDRSNRLRAAVCVAGPRNRFHAKRREEISDLVKETANVIQIQMDYRPR